MEPGKPKDAEALPRPEFRPPPTYRQSPFNTTQHSFQQTRSTTMPSPFSYGRPTMVSSASQADPPPPEQDFIAQTPTRVEWERDVRLAPSHPPPSPSVSQTARPSRLSPVRFDSTLQASVSRIALSPLPMSPAPSRQRVRATQSSVGSRAGRTRVSTSRLPLEAVEYEDGSPAGNIAVPSHKNSFRRSRSQAMSSVQVVTVSSPAPAPASERGPVTVTTETLDKFLPERGQGRVTVTTERPDDPIEVRSPSPEFELDGSPQGTVMIESMGDDPVEVPAPSPDYELDGSTRGTVLIESMKEDPPPVYPGFDFSYPPSLAGQPRPATLTAREWDELILVGQFLTAIPGPRPMLDGLLGVSRSPETKAPSHSPRRESPLRRSMTSSVPQLNSPMLSVTVESESDSELASPHGLSPRSAIRTSPVRERSATICTADLGDGPSLDPGLGRSFSSLSTVSNASGVTGPEAPSTKHTKPPAPKPKPRLPSRLVTRTGSGHRPNKGYTPFHSPYPEVSELDDVQTAIQRQIEAKRKLTARKRPPEPRGIPLSGAGTVGKPSLVAQVKPMSPPPQLKVNPPPQPARDLDSPIIEIEAVDSDSDTAVEKSGAGGGDFSGFDDMLQAVAIHLGLPPEQVTAADVERLLQSMS
ncbi:hypothetical protein J8273_4047 [Carpediemonas membranifera]|uniref:Uncharacterized protein n=1 Tax=Carpediemonas membranifera TaxID=201153 RepID=A0A8J6E292_9EUKA|nr:hypothetical protein J8273_4047 [Carpediemonas membranifera]|eukprot:KAG9394403.1 hypothetical protein J8273_4047 [Carpediemonas membranifera]